MAESAARRDRIESKAVAGWYLWEAPQKLICVYLSFDVIDRMEHETVENFRSLTSRGSEMGGILLGGVVPGTAGISVEDYETIECDYSRGPLYRLSDADLSRFERAIEEHSNGSTPQVVGFFRSHTRKGLFLDAEDLQFLEARFRNPHSVALLVRPFATKASVAGIFLREEGGFNSEASALEFPFRSAELTPSKRGPESSASGPAPVRAQVVPIATRREIAVPPAAPALPVPTAEPVAQEPTAKLAADPKPPATTTVVVDPPPPAAAEAPQAPAAVVAPPSPKAAPAPAVELAPAVKIDLPTPKWAMTEAPALAESKRSSKVPLLTGLLAAALLAFVLLFIYPGFVHQWQRPSGNVVQDSSPLTLRVEHTGTDLLLTWNRESAAIRSASRATLSISDGERHENYDMDLGQLRTGSIVYSPLGGDVSFQMEVIGQNGSHTATETLRLLQTRPSPMPAEGQQAATEKTGKTASPSSNAPSTASAGNSSDTPAAGAAAEQEVKPAVAPVKPFDTSSLKQRLRPAQPTDLADVPSPSAGGSPRINTDSSLPLSVTAAPAPTAPTAPAVVVPASTSQSAGKQSNPSAGGQIQQAQLIFRKEPEYPALARQTRASGAVELTATIGTDGSVKAVKVIKGHPLLVKSAEQAVMQWRYRPTILNGNPVQSDVRITLTFQRQQ
jgi:TonB family protein